MLRQKLVFYGLLCMCIWLPYDTHAQTVKRQCVSSYAASGRAEGVSLSQTAGQAYYTASSSDGKTAVLNGFQQPANFKVEKIETNEDFLLNMKVFPNPANLSVTLQSPEPHSKLTIVVNNASGQTVFKENIPEFSKYTIQTEAWKNGIYFITVQGENSQRSSFKLIINN